MEEILNYLRDTYHPTAILLYGSYANGINDETSDFDCMILVKGKDHNHDGRVINGVTLDCFIYTEEEAETEDPDIFLPAYDAILAEDSGAGAKLKVRVHEYVAENSDIGEEEKQFIESWICKTMKRTEKKDDEGNYRAVAFLSESLADYFLLRGMFYFGSRKAVRYLQMNDSEGYELYHRAITERTNEDIRAWARYVVN